jgi:hypothetical protein
MHLGPNTVSTVCVHHTTKLKCNYNLQWFSKHNIYKKPCVWHRMEMSSQLHAPHPLALPQEISRVPDINKDWVGSTVGVDVLPLPAIERFLLRAAHGLVNIVTTLSWLPITRSTSIRYILLHSRSPPMCSCSVVPKLGATCSRHISHLVTFGRIRSRKFHCCVRITFILNPIVSHMPSPFANLRPFCYLSMGQWHCVIQWLINQGCTHAGRLNFVRWRLTLQGPVSRHFSCP